MDNLRLGIIIFVVAFILGGLVTCNCGRPQKGYYNDGGDDTVYVTKWRVDTFVLVAYEPKPVSVEVPVPYIPDGYVKAPVVDPQPQIEYGEVHDSSYIAYLARVKDDYFSKYYYKDSIVTPFATIYIEDTLHRNRIKSRKPLIVTRIPVTTTTIYREPEKRTQFFAGGLAQYATDTTLGVGFQFALKFKNDLTINGAALLDTRQRQLFQVGLLKPISLRRRK